MIVGIDFGSQLAGTTAICYGSLSDGLNIIRSAKNQNADDMIKEFYSSHSFVTIIGIDAPLSVPNGILGTGNQFIFRLCDQQLSAMSPMFLGGLTARAMKLRHDLLKTKEADILEVYPKALVNLVCHQEIRPIYKSKEHIEDFINAICQQFTIQVKHSLKDWHEVDAVLAWISAHRYSTNEHLKFGDEDGWIIV